MKLCKIELQLCSACTNRPLCLPQSEFPQLTMVREKNKHRDFLYFKKGDFVFKTGDNADGVFCIYSGKVEVFNDINIQKVTDGDIIGFNSIKDEHYINSARAIEDVFCCFLKLSEVQSLIKKRHPVAEKITVGF